MKNSANLPLFDFTMDESIASEDRVYSNESANKLMPSPILGSPRSLIVNSLADVIDAKDGVTTLREAIAFANSQSGVSIINFDLAAGSQINLTKELAIRSDLVLNGNGVTIAGNGTFDNFLVNNANVVFNGFRIINGQDGIGVRNNSTVTVNDSLFYHNGQDGIDVNGKNSTVIIRNSSLINNAADGIDITGDRNRITVSNTSFTGNGASGVLLDASARDNLVTLIKDIFSDNGDQAIADQGRQNTVLPIDVSISLAIQNAGFENPVLDDFTFTTTAPPGWQLYNPDGLIPDVTTDDSSSPGTFNPSTANYPNGVPEGNNVGNVFLVDEIGSGRAGLSQTLDTRLAANTRYTLLVDVGNPTGDDPVPGISFAGFPGYQIELLAGGHVLNLDSNSLEIAEGTFGTSTVTYTTSATDPLLGKPLEIRLINLLQGPGIEVDFDNVRLTAQPLSIANGSTRSYRPDAGLPKLSEPLYGSSPLHLAVGSTPSLFTN